MCSNVNELLHVLFMNPDQICQRGRGALETLPPLRIRNLSSRTSLCLTKPAAFLTCHFVFAHCEFF